MRRCLLVVLVMFVLACSQERDAPPGTSGASSKQGVGSPIRPPMDTAAIGSVRRALGVPGARIEYRWLERPPVPGHPVATDASRHDQVSLADKLPLADGDIISALAMPAGHATSIVVLKIKEDAAVRLFTATSAREGHEVGVVMNGVLIVTAILQTPISYDPIVTNLIPRPLADSLAVRIRAHHRTNAETSSKLRRGAT